MLFNLFTPSYPVVDVNIPEGWWKQDAQLDLDFANKRAYNKFTQFRGRPDSILTYTSPSPKMVYDVDGVLRYAPHNLLVYSEAFSNGAYWIDGAISASGTRVNGSVSVSADNGYAYVRQNFTAINKTVVASYEVTCDTTVADVPIVFSNGVTNYPVVTSFVAGVPQRVTSPAFSVTTQVSVGIDLRDAVAPGGSNTTGYTITFNKAQLQLYPNHDTSTYIPTTSAAVYSLPIDHDPITHAPLGVLIEEQRTNLLTQSQTQTTGWSFDASTGSGITLDGGLGPDGVNQICTFNEGTSTSAHRANKSTTTVAATAYTYSAYFRAGTSRYIIFGSTRGGIAIDTVDWSITETITSAGTTVTNGTVTQVSADIYRASVTVSHTSDTTSFLVVSTAITGTPGLMAPSFLGTGRTALFGFCQIEVGAFPTSYIPTVASQVTRAADQVSILTSAFAYNAAEGTIVCNAIASPETASNAPITVQSLWTLDDTVNDNNVIIALRSGFSTTPDNSVGFAAKLSTAGQWELFGVSVVANRTEFTLATAFKANDVAMSLDGATAVTDASASIPSVSRLVIGGRPSLADVGPWRSHIKRVTYFPTRKSNAELQGLSA